MARRREFATSPSWMPRARSRGSPASRRVARWLGEGAGAPPAPPARPQPRAREPRHAEPLARGSDLDGEVGVALELLDDAARVGRLHHAVHGLAPPVSSLVREERHAHSPFRGSGGNVKRPPFTSDSAPGRAGPSRFTRAANESERKKLSSSCCCAELTAGTFGETKRKAGPSAGCVYG